MWESIILNVFEACKLTRPASWRVSGERFVLPGLLLEYRRYSPCSLLFPQVVRGLHCAVSWSHAPSLCCSFPCALVSPAAHYRSRLFIVLLIFRWSFLWSIVSSCSSCCYTWFLPCFITIWGAFVILLDYRWRSFSSSPFLRSFLDYIRSAVHVITWPCYCSYQGKCYELGNGVEPNLMASIKNIFVELLGNFPKISSYQKCICSVT